MLIADIITRVQRQFGDESGVQVNEADILRWINDAQNEAVLQHEGLLTTSIQIPTVANQQTYSLPVNCIDVLTLKTKTSGAGSFNNLQVMTRKQLDEYINNWEGTDYVGDPTYYARGKAVGSFSVFPVPDSALTTFELYYSRYAVNVSTASDLIDLPAYYHPYVMEFCLMKAYEMDEEWDSADRKAAYVQSTLDANAAREDVFSKQTYPVVTAVSEDY